VSGDGLIWSPVSWFAALETASGCAEASWMIAPLLFNDAIFRSGE